jgi:hypothetical protein
VRSVAHTTFEEFDDDFGMVRQVLSALISVFSEGQNTETIEKLSATLRGYGRSDIIFSNSGLDPGGGGLNNSS